MKTKPVKPKYEIYIASFGKYSYRYEVIFNSFFINSLTEYRSEKLARAAANRALATLRKELCKS